MSSSLSPEPIRFDARLLHADGNCRIVKVSAYCGDGTTLGSTLAEAATAEAAEDRARQRLQQRLAGPTNPVGPRAAGPIPVPKPPESDGGRQLAADRLTESQVAPQPAEPQPVEPPADPDDWSEELATIDAELQRLGWGRSEEGTYLQRWSGHASRSRITTYADLSSYLHSLRHLPEDADPTTAAMPLRRADLLAQSDQLLTNLGWTADQGRQLLASHFDAQSRRQLNDQQLLAFNLLLEAKWLQDPAGPCG